MGSEPRACPACGTVVVACLCSMLRRGQRTMIWTFAGHLNPRTAAFCICTEEDPRCAEVAPVRR